MALVSDNGLQFCSHAFAAFLKERGIKHIRTSLYYPHSNGAAERFIPVLKECVQNAEKGQLPWKPEVTSFLQSYRATRKKDALTLMKMSERLSKINKRKWKNMSSLCLVIALIREQEGQFFPCPTEHMATDSCLIAEGMILSPNVFSGVN